MKNPPAMQEMRVRSLGGEDPLEEGMATHSSIFARRIPWTEELGGLSPRGCKESGTIKVTEHVCVFTLKIILFTIQKLGLNKIYRIPKVLYTGSITDFNGRI